MIISIWSLVLLAVSATGEINTHEAEKDTSLVDDTAKQENGLVSLAHSSSVGDDRRERRFFVFRPYGGNILDIIDIAHQRKHLTALSRARQRSWLFAMRRARYLAQHRSQLITLIRARYLARQRARWAALMRARLLAQKRARWAALRRARFLAQKRSRWAALMRARLSAQKRARWAALRRARFLAQKRSRWAALMRARLSAQKRARWAALRRARFLAQKLSRWAALRRARWAALMRTRLSAQKRARWAALRRTRWAASMRARLSAQTRAQWAALRRARMRARFAFKRGYRVGYTNGLKASTGSKARRIRIINNIFIPLRELVRKFVSSKNFQIARRPTKTNQLLLAPKRARQAARRRARYLARKRARLAARRRLAGRKLKVRAHCPKSSWESGIISGTYIPMGHYGGRIIYMNTKRDPNKHWWRMSFSKNRWVFTYSRHQVRRKSFYRYRGYQNSDRVIRKGHVCSFKLDYGQKRSRHLARLAARKRARYLARRRHLARLAARRRHLARLAARRRARYLARKRARLAARRRARYLARKRHLARLAARRRYLARRKRKRCRYPRYSHRYLRRGFKMFPGR